MAQQYKLKDKKIAIWRLTTTKVNGVNVKQYNRLIEGKIWAFYQQNGGTYSLEGSGTAVKFYDSIERATFVINNRSDVKPKATDIVILGSKIYDINVVDDFQGYKDDIKLICTLASSQDPSKYNGLVID